MAIGTSTSGPKDNPTIMAATMMIVSVACARLPKSARGPLNRAYRLLRALRQLLSVMGRTTSENARSQR